MLGTIPPSLSLVNDDNGGFSPSEWAVSGSTANPKNGPQVIPQRFFIPLFPAKQEPEIFRVYHCLSVPRHHVSQIASNLPDHSGVISAVAFPNHGIEGLKLSGRFHTERVAHGKHQ